MALMRCLTCQKTTAFAGRVEGGRLVNCPKCVRRLKARPHADTCRAMRAATAAFPVECEHGRTSCPVCDPCDCKPTT
jgi:hypothetical protein